MKAKSKQRKGKLLVAVVCLFVIASTLIAVTAKGNQRKIVGYTYDSGNTVWEMAERHCPDDMDIRDFVREIKKANGMYDSVVYKYETYKIPVYETESEYLDMNTVVGYEVSDGGVLLITDNGNGYFIEK